MLDRTQIGKFAECAGDLSFVQNACAAVFVSLNNCSIVSFCCFAKISRLEPWLKFKVRGREIGRARQTFQSGIEQSSVHDTICYKVLYLSIPTGTQEGCLYMLDVNDLESLYRVSQKKVPTFENS